MGIIITASLDPMKLMGRCDTPRGKLMCLLYSYRKYSKEKAITRSFSTAKN